MIDVVRTRPARAAVALAAASLLVTGLTATSLPIPDAPAGDGRATVAPGVEAGVEVRVTVAGTAVPLPHHSTVLVADVDGVEHAANLAAALGPGAVPVDLATLDASGRAAPADAVVDASRGTVDDGIDDGIDSSVDGTATLSGPPVLDDTTPAVVVVDRLRDALPHTEGQECRPAVDAAAVAARAAVRHPLTVLVVEVDHTPDGAAVEPSPTGIAPPTADVAPADVAPADVAPADVAPADVAPADVAAEDRPADGVATDVAPDVARTGVPTVVRVLVPGVDDTALAGVLRGVTSAARTDAAAPTSQDATTDPAAALVVPAAPDLVVPAAPDPVVPAAPDPVPASPGAPASPAPGTPTPGESAACAPAPAPEPVPTEPVPTEPAPTEPVPTEPVPTEPAPTEPAPTVASPLTSTSDASAAPAPSLTTPWRLPSAAATPGLALALDVAGVHLGDAVGTDDRWRLTGLLTGVRVVDARTTQPGRGWTLAAQVSDLAGPATLPAARIGWVPQVADARAAAGPAVAGALSGGPGLADPAVLASADRATAGTPVALDAQIVLETPRDTPPGTYSGTLTLTLFPEE